MLVKETFSRRERERETRRERREKSKRNKMLKEPKLVFFKKTEFTGWCVLMFDHHPHPTT